MALLNFLKQRCIPNAEEIVQEMEIQKIDVNVIKEMPTDDLFLMNILPQYGDRLALINFAKQTNISKRKSALFDKLLSKVHTDSDDINYESKTEFSNPSLSLKKNSCHTSLKRFVEIGWLNFKVSAYKQVRTRYGGGTRKVKVKKTLLKTDLIDLAKTLFFPNGESSKGKIEQFSTDLFDFQRNILPSNLTVGELYTTTGLNSLRFYLATNLKKDIPLPKKSFSELSVEAENLFDNSQSNSPNLLESWSSTNIESELHNSPVYSDTKVYDNNLDAVSCNNTFEQVSYFNLNEHNCYDVLEPHAEKTKLILHRGQIFNELIETFKHFKKYPSQIEFELILPNGHSENAIDVGGVFKDVLSEFWSSFYEMATTGCHWKVPIIRHDFQDKEWCAIAKIIFIGWRDIQYLPLSLALPFMECVFCETTINSPDLIERFFKTLPLRSNDLLKSAIKDFNKIDQDELLDVLQEFDCRLIVHERNIEDIISEIAHKEIIQRPKYIIDIWSDELKHKISPTITLSTLKEIYTSKTPTSTNILNNLLCPDKDENEIKRMTYGFFKKFIREADQNLCTKLLRFITGADIITNSININFTSAKNGFIRSPVAHTCTNTLDLPMSYDRFIDLRSEFTSLLSSNIWVMDMA